MAVTSMYLPSGAPESRSSTESLTFAFQDPCISSSSLSRPRRAATEAMEVSGASWAIAMSEGTGERIVSDVLRPWSVIG